MNFEKDFSGPQTLPFRLNLDLLISVFPGIHSVFLVNYTVETNHFYYENSLLLSVVIPGSRACRRWWSGRTCPEPG